MRMRRSSSTTSRSVCTFWIRQIEIDHAVGVERHDEPQPVARDLLVERRVVVGGERVVLAAVARDGLRELVARHACRAAKHHVLEEMREPARPGGSSIAPTRYQSICVTIGAR